MSSLMTSLGIDRLSVDDRVALAHEIWQSVEAETAAAPLTDAQRQELERRLAAADANPAAVTPWEEVQARILGRLRQ